MVSRPELWEQDFTVSLVGMLAPEERLALKYEADRLVWAGGDATLEVFAFIDWTAVRFFLLDVDGCFLAMKEKMLTRGRSWGRKLPTDLIANPLPRWYVMTLPQRRTRRNSVSGSGGDHKREESVAISRKLGDVEVTLGPRGRAPHRASRPACGPPLRPSTWFLCSPSASLPPPRPRSHSASERPRRSVASRDARG